MYPTLDHVTIDLVRKIYPTLLATSITGVQPTTADAAAVFNLRIRYTAKIERYFRMVDKSYYKNFLRINNRKASVTAADIERANYPLVELTYDQYKIREEIFDWCEKTFPHGSWITDEYELIAFSKTEQATMFKIAWTE